MKNKNDEQKRIKQMGIFILVPFVLAVPPIIGWFIGKWLDQELQLEFLKYVFVLLGCAAGFREFYRMVKRFGDDS